jgi:two-component system, LytTR family, sensor kinase
MQRLLSIHSWLYRYKAHHILLWVLYFLFWVSFYRPYYPTLLSIIVVTSVYFVFTAFAFYSVSYWANQKFLNTRQYGKFFLWAAAIILGSSVGLAVCLKFVFRNVREMQDVGFHGLLMFAFVSISTMAGMLTGAKIVIDRIRHDRKQEVKNRQQLETELQYLKAQVNPHFLFNAINSVYFLIKKNPNEAAETLIKLSDLLRFQLYDCSEDKIPIEKEIEYLNNFIDLEKVRRGKKVKVEVKHEGNLSGFHIAPFLLIPFVENAFKHVSNRNQDENRVLLTFKREDNWFRARIENSNDHEFKNGPGGIGLKNVTRRLELLYPGRHLLKILDEDGRYVVELDINIA